MGVTMKIAKMTDAEHLEIRRRRMDKTEREMADHLKVGRRAYDRMAAGTDPVPAAVRVNPETLEAHEVCFLRRRRAALSRKEMARLVGVSEWWLTQMERGREAPDRLVAFWASNPR